MMTNRLDVAIRGLGEAYTTAYEEALDYRKILRRKSSKISSENRKLPQRMSEKRDSERRNKTKGISLPKISISQPED